MKVKVLAILAVILFLFTVFNPPWRITVKDHAGHTRKTVVVWAYLGSPPSVAGQQYQAAAIAMDVIGLELLAVIASAAAAMFIAKAK